MSIQWYIVLLPSIALICIGLVVISIGIFGLVNKRTVFIRNLFYYGSSLLLSISFLYFPVLFIVTAKPGTIAGQIVLLLLCILPAILFIIFRIFTSRSRFLGYTLIGIDNSILEAIKSVLIQNGIVFEERHEDFWLPELNSWIITSFSVWNGTVNIHLEPWNKSCILDPVITSMKSHLLEKEYYFDDSAMMRFTAYGIVAAIIGMIFTIAVISKG